MTEGLSQKAFRVLEMDRRKPYAYTKINKNNFFDLFTAMIDRGLIIEISDFRQIKRTNPLLSNDIILRKCFYERSFDNDNDREKVKNNGNESVELERRLRRELDKLKNSKSITPKENKKLKSKIEMLENIENLEKKIIKTKKENKKKIKKLKEQKTNIENDNLSKIKELEQEIIIIKKNDSEKNANLESKKNTLEKKILKIEANSKKEIGKLKEEILKVEANSEEEIGKLEKKLKSIVSKIPKEDPISQAIAFSNGNKTLEEYEKIDYNLDIISVRRLISDLEKRLKSNLKLLDNLFEESKEKRLYSLGRINCALNSDLLYINEDIDKLNDYVEFSNFNTTILNIGSAQECCDFMFIFTATNNWSNQNGETITIINNSNANYTEYCTIEGIINIYDDNILDRKLAYLYMVKYAIFNVIIKGADSYFLKEDDNFLNPISLLFKFVDDKILKNNIISIIIDENIISNGIIYVAQAACMAGKFETFELLFNYITEKGVNFYNININILDYAYFGGSMNIIEFLKEKGFRVSSRVFSMLFASKNLLLIKDLLANGHNSLNKNKAFEITNPFSSKIEEDLFFNYDFPLLGLCDLSIDSTLENNSGFNINSFIKYTEEESGWAIFEKIDEPRIFVELVKIKDFLISNGNIFTKLILSILKSNDKQITNLLYLFMYENIITINDIDFNMIDEEKRTVLHYAVMNRNIEIIDILLNYAISGLMEISKKDKYGMTPLSIAVENKDLELVKLFHKKKIIPKENDSNAIHLAIKNKDIEMLKFLLSYEDMNINVEDEYGLGPIYSAVADTMNLEIVRLLLSDERLEMKDGEIEDLIDIAKINQKAIWNLELGNKRKVGKILSKKFNLIEITFQKIPEFKMLRYEDTKQVIDELEKYKNKKAIKNASETEKFCTEENLFFSHFL